MPRREYDTNSTFFVSIAHLQDGGESHPDAMWRQMPAWVWEELYFESSYRTIISFRREDGYIGIMKKASYLCRNAAIPVEELTEPGGK